MKLEVSNNKLESIKKNERKLKNTAAEIKKKNTLERTENKLDDTKKQISKLEEKVVEITEIEQKEEKNLKMRTV